MRNRQSFQPPENTRLWFVAGFTALVLIGLAAAGPGLWPFYNEALAGTVYRSFSMLCHQLPERSLVLNGHLTFVCTRCLGFYSGLVLGWLICGLSIIGVPNIPLPGRRFRNKLLPGILMVIGLDVFAQFIGLWHTSNGLRFFLGIVLGFGVIHFIYFSNVMQSDILNIKSNESTHGTIR